MTASPKYLGYHDGLLHEKPPESPVNVRSFACLLFERLAGHTREVLLTREDINSSYLILPGHIVHEGQSIRQTLHKVAQEQLGLPDLVFPVALTARVFETFLQMPVAQGRVRYDHCLTNVIKLEIEPSIPPELVQDLSWRRWSTLQPWEIFPVLRSAIMEHKSERIGGYRL